MIFVKDRDWNLPKLFKELQRSRIFLILILVISFYVKILQKKIIGLDSMFFMSIYSKNQVDPAMQPSSHKLTLQYLTHPEDKLVLI